MSDYVSFDRQDDALISLALFCDALKMIPEDIRYWKHAIISMHNALQGFICISIRNGNSLLTLKKHHMKKWLEAHYQDKDYPETQLDFFMELFDKCFSAESAIDRDSIEWLNNTRNLFIHFNSDSFSICHRSAHNCTKEALKAIVLTQSLATGIFFYEESQSKEFESLCSKAEVLLSEYIPE